MLLAMDPYLLIKISKPAEDMLQTANIIPYTRHLSQCCGRLPRRGSSFTIYQDYQIEGTYLLGRHRTGHIIGTRKCLSIFSASHSSISSPSVPRGSTPFTWTNERGGEDSPRILRRFSPLRTELNHYTCHETITTQSRATTMSIVEPPRRHNFETGNLFFFFLFSLHHIAVRRLIALRGCQWWCLCMEYYFSISMLTTSAINRTQCKHMARLRSGLMFKISFKQQFFCSTFFFSSKQTSHTSDNNYENKMKSLTLHTSYKSSPNNTLCAGATCSNCCWCAMQRKRRYTNEILTSARSRVILRTT